MGPGTGTPQCRITLAGEPHAAVACASVSRRAAPATVAGMRTIIAAQSGSAAAGAGVRETVGAHAARTPTTSSAATLAAGVRTERDGLRLRFL
ncbi:hypothetical protein GCM10025866_22030 [Naasia aerilata]|uniref:Uncharacterized protein n=1 Tax=Naasia aerilata TaxID=1162966 RepID=A0ABN6XMU0_9MICO|nr:hypothetical protein GCM10025866_22030 [Naasia aerilata]